jgi:hypothetical protein
MVSTRSQEKKPGGDLDDGKTPGAQHADKMLIDGQAADKNLAKGKKGAADPDDDLSEADLLLKNELEAFVAQLKVATILRFHK